MKRRWLKLGIICIFIFTLSGLFVLGLNIYRVFYQPMLSATQSNIIISLDKSTTASAFVNHLKKQNLIVSDRLFLILIRLQGLSSNLKAGIYQIYPGESAQQFLYRVVRGDVLKKSFAIIEGTTQKQVTVNLLNAPFLNFSEEDWITIKGTYVSAEGLLLADTYVYDAGSKALNVLSKAHASLTTFLDNSWAHRSIDLPYKSAYELLITASIIEKESSLAKEKKLISGVIANRLRKKMPLQMDPTIVYGLGSAYTGKLTKDNMHVDSLYNSYRYRGLPPTPICMVGKDAIEAAAHPTNTNYLYFVAKGDGSHEFSVTYEQQKEAINRYLKKGFTHDQ